MAKIIHDVTIIDSNWFSRLNWIGDSRKVSGLQRKFCLCIFPQCVCVCVLYIIAMYHFCAMERWIFVGSTVCHHELICIIVYNRNHKLVDKNVSAATITLPQNLSEVFGVGISTFFPRFVSWNSPDKLQISLFIRRHSHRHITANKVQMLISLCRLYRCYSWHWQQQFKQLCTVAKT